jgi:outer membrane protein OmpA-like peptidoglycan-associated protein
MLLLNQQHWPGSSGYLVTGEHAPVVLWLSLFVVGILTTVLDVHLWSSLAKRSPNTALTPVTAPVLPVAAGKSLPTALPVPAEKSSPALDCPPLFSVSFEMNSDTPRFKRADLDALVAWLLDHPQSMLVIDGHADSQGTSAANLTLSRSRANEMAKRFVAAHLPFKRITLRAFGQYVPLVGIPEQSSKNRRVVLRVTKTANCPTSEEL